jgi:hypothetical protein
MRLENAWAMMLAVSPGAMPLVEFLVDVNAATTLRAELRVSSKPENHTPDVTLAAQEIGMQPGVRIKLPLKFDAKIGVPRYAFVCLMANPDVAVHLSDQRVTGVLAVTQKFNRAVAKSPRQTPPPDSGIDSFEFWIPIRRPGGKNLAVQISPPLEVFSAANLISGIARPTNQPNAWVADFADGQPVVRLSWDAPQTIARIELCFDNDFDHPMESVLLGSPERVMPFCVSDVTVAPGENIEGNHHSTRVIQLREPVKTSSLEIRLKRANPLVPAALFAVRCYAEKG